MTTQQRIDPMIQKPGKADDVLVDGCKIRILLKIERELTGLATANKNRVLLAVHHNIGVQLEALEADNHE